MTIIDWIFYWVGAIVCVVTAVCIAGYLACVLWSAFTALLFTIRLWWDDLTVEGRFWTAWWTIFSGGHDKYRYVTVRATGERIYWPLWPRASDGDDE